MKKTRKLPALLLVVLLLLSLLVSCRGGGNTDNNNAAAPGRTLRIASMQDSGTLHPLGVTGAFIAPLYAFYEPLYDTRADGSAGGCLPPGLTGKATSLHSNHPRGRNVFNGNRLRPKTLCFHGALQR